MDDDARNMLEDMLKASDESLVKIKELVEIANERCKNGMTEKDREQGKKFYECARKFQKKQVEFSSFLRQVLEGKNP